MTTLTNASRAVKIAPGLAEPRPPRPAPTTTHPWELPVRADLARLDYCPAAVGAAVCWIDSRGTIDGCPCVERSDWQAINAIVARPTAPDLDQPDGGDTEADPADWPGWTDDDRWAATDPEPDPTAAPARSFTPTDAESKWWACESTRLTEARRGHTPTRRRTAQPNVTDADVIRGTGCVG